MGQFDAEQLEESTTSLVSSSTSAYSSFPVDVVVYVRVQVLTAGPVFKPAGCDSQFCSTRQMFSSPLRSASAACPCPGWSVCSSFPLWTWSSLLTGGNGRTPQEPTHPTGLTHPLPLHQDSTFPRRFPVKVCKKLSGNCAINV